MDIESCHASNHEREPSRAAPTRLVIDPESARWDIGLELNWPEEERRELSTEVVIGPKVLIAHIWMSGESGSERRL